MKGPVLEKISFKFDYSAANECECRKCGTGITIMGFYASMINIEIFGVLIELLLDVHVQGGAIINRYFLEIEERN